MIYNSNGGIRHYNNYTIIGMIHTSFIFNQYIIKFSYCVIMSKNKSIDKYDTILIVNPIKQYYITIIN